LLLLISRVGGSSSSSSWCFFWCGCSRYFVLCPKYKVQVVFILVPSHPRKTVKLSICQSVNCQSVKLSVCQSFNLPICQTVIRHPLHSSPPQRSSPPKENCRPLQRLATLKGTTVFHWREDIRLSRPAQLDQESGGFPATSKLCLAADYPPLYRQSTIDYRP
jgi:hypothetical protein